MCYARFVFLIATVLMASLLACSQQSASMITPTPLSVEIPSAQTLKPIATSAPMIPIPTPNVTSSRNTPVPLKTFIAKSGLTPTIAEVQAQSKDPVPNLHSANHLSSSSVSASNDGRVVVAVNPDSDSITVIGSSDFKLLGEIPVGDNPRNVSITTDSNYALITDHDSATVSVVDLVALEKIAQWAVGDMPYGIVAGSDYVFIAEFGISSVAILDLHSGEVIKRIKVKEFPAGLALNEESGILLITHLFSGAVSVVDTKTLSVKGEITTGADTNLSQSVVLVKDGSQAYVPQTRFNVENNARLFDNTVFPIVNVVDIDNLKLLTQSRITLDTADQPVNMPFSVALSPDENILYIANAGSDDISVINLDVNKGIAHIEVGSNPRGVVLSPNGSHLYVNNVLDGSLSVIDTETFVVNASIRLTEIPLSATLLKGKRIFNSASEPKLTTDHWISCATCHFNGMMDRETWIAFPDGPRNTPALFDLRQTLPMHWSGDFDELQDVEVTIREIQFGTGLIPGPMHDTLEDPHAGLSNELDSLAAYLSTIKPPDSPFRNDLLEIANGRTVFANLGCQTCHTEPFYTDQELHDVGTGDPDLERNSHGRGTKFDTPSLNSVWLTAPYFHDGSADTLEKVLQTGTVHDIFGDLSPGELKSLVGFLKSLPEDPQ